MDVAATRPPIPPGLLARGVVAIGRYIAAEAVTSIDLGPGILVAKLGRSGALAFDRDGEDMAVDLATALDLGNACGAVTAAALGDQTGLPDRAELEAILRASREDGAPDTIR